MFFLRFFATRVVILSNAVRDQFTFMRNQQKDEALGKSQIVS